jgi:hypothetical protein
MSIEVPLYQFQRSSPFYPLVTNYIVLLLGFKEFTASGIALAIQRLPADERAQLLEDARAKGNFEVVERLASITPTELHPPLELVSELENHRIRIDAEETMLELMQNTSHLIPFLKRTAMGSLLIHAYEATEQFHDRTPLWEFLRHCRNAAAHGGRFSFQHGEPRRPAIWGRYRIDASLEGTWLAATEDAAGLLAPGDPLRLLWDIEQATPNMVWRSPTI